MKGILILALCLLAGCTVGPTLEQLESQALVTGDWSLVEKREAMIARRNTNPGINCPSGYIAYCESYRIRKPCSCVSQGFIFSLVGD
jgi:hypothetical protein